MLGTQLATMNRLMDRAGRHRRIAACFAATALPVLIMGAAVVADHPWFAVFHLAVAASLLWVSGDLIRGGTMVDGAGWPHAALGALAGSFVLLRLTAPASLDDILGVQIPLFVGHGVLVVSIAVLALADRRLDPVVMCAGRMLLVLGGTIFGSTQLFRLANGLETHTWYSIGVGLVGVAFFSLSLSEARLVRRSLQLLTVDR